MKRLQAGEKVELRFLERLRARCPDNVQILEALGNLYTRIGKFTEGLAVDREIVQARPEDETAWYNLACSYALTGHPDDAIAALEKAIKLGYRDFRWMQRDPDLKSLHADPRFQALVRSRQKRSG